MKQDSESSVVSSPVKNCAVAFKKLGLSESPRESFLMPASFSQNLVNGRNPQMLARGFSRRLNVGLNSSCSTLSLRSSGATSRLSQSNHYQLLCF